MRRAAFVALAPIAVDRTNKKEDTDMRTQQNMPRCSDVDKMTQQVVFLMAQAVAGKVQKDTHDKLLAFSELEPDEADEVSLALGQAFWKSLWDLLSLLHRNDRC
jgi:hypothetical protein